MKVIYDPYLNTILESQQVGEVSDRARFEYCADSHGEPQYIRFNTMVTVAYQELIPNSLRNVKNSVWVESTHLSYRIF